jgi:hypothetical protein
MSRKAIPQTPPPKPEPEVHSYRVLSRKFVLGKKGEVIRLALGDREAALLAAGTLERAEDDNGSDKPTDRKEG